MPMWRLKSFAEPVAREVNHSCRGQKRGASELHSLQSGDACRRAQDSLRLQAKQCEAPMPFRRSDSCRVNLEQSPGALDMCIRFSISGGLRATVRGPFHTYGKTPAWTDGSPDASGR